jgi:hypothetical protein
MALTRLLSVRLVTAVMFAVTALAVLPAGAAANPGHFRGVVTASTPSGRAYKAKVHPARQRRGGANNLAYHGGPVMHSDGNYTIYWVPSGYSLPAGYTGTVNAFFSNVAAASGSTTNDYGVVRQYYDGSGNGAYSATVTGSGTDATAYPASGCRSGSGPCITDSQLQTEVNKYVTAHGLPRGLGNVYFVYFPAGVTTCFDSAGSQCSGTTYCAYHSSLGSGSTSTLYANMPYAGVSGCESGQYPNGSAAADSVINVTSHENIEAVTDPLGTAWYDSSGNEIGDKCAWNFGSALGGSPGAEYNEAIASGHYYLQQEWSNANSGCVQRY